MSDNSLDLITFVLRFVKMDKRMHEHCYRINNVPNVENNNRVPSGDLPCLRNKDEPEQPGKTSDEVDSGNMITILFLFWHKFVFNSLKLPSPLFLLFQKAGPLYHNDYKRSYNLSQPLIIASTMLKHVTV